ncbi:MAG: hypothetical protein OEY19_10920 [Gammaproteobacteria bacterium]|nr:hypothetical protein [Gammaproteobacteria bacterium]
MNNISTNNRFPRLIFLILFTVSIFSGCDTGTPSFPNTQYTYYKDTKNIIDTNCSTCHSKGNPAVEGTKGDFSLEEYRDVLAKRSAMVYSIETGSMPLGFPLSVNDKAIMLDWLNGGAPEGNPGDFVKSLDYFADALPVFYESCISCHGQGNALPSLIDYPAVSNYLSLLPNKNAFNNLLSGFSQDMNHGALMVTQASLDTLSQWVVDGVAEGSKPFYEMPIKGILADNCTTSCHNPNASQGVDDLTNYAVLYEKLYVDTAGETVVNTVTYQIQNNHMDGQGASLTIWDKATIEYWINDGPPVPVSDPGPTPANIAYNNGIKPIIDKYCVGCHVPNNFHNTNGRKPLASYQQLTNLGGRTRDASIQVIYDRVFNGSMPNVNATYPFSDDPYTQSYYDKRTLLDWINMGAPEN